VGIVVSFFTGLLCTILMGDIQAGTGIGQYVVAVLAMATTVAYMAHNSSQSMSQGY
jgi:hypothetical protein